MRLATLEAAYVLYIQLLDKWLELTDTIMGLAPA